MRRAAAVLLTSVPIAFCFGVLLAYTLFRNLEAALIGGVLFGAPLGLVGGCVALLLLRSGKVPPRDRWVGRGSLLGIGVGAIGAAVWPLVVRQYTLASLYGLLGAIGGALAGGTTGGFVRRLFEDDADPSEGPEPGHGKV